MPFPSNPNIGDTYQPTPPTSPTYIYRGGKKWDLYTTGVPLDLTNYYTKAQVDGLQGTQDAAITAASQAAAVAQANANTRILSTEKAAANGVATLNGSGKIPAGQIDLTGLIPVTSVAAKTGAVTLVKADVGLGNVDNTADAAKPVSDATQDALDLKADLADYTNYGVLNLVKTVDGPFSGLDADLLDGYHGSAFVRTVNSSGPDGAGNVTVLVPISDIRLGANLAVSSASPVAQTVYFTAGYVMVGTFYSSPDFSWLSRPIQKLSYGTWYTVAQT